MKKLFSLLFLFSLITVAFSQERTTATQVIPENGTYLLYTGILADTLKATNQDTIDLIIKYQGLGFVKKVSVKSRFDVIAGADTTVSVSVYGKEFLDDPTWVQVIAATTSNAVAANNTIQILTSKYTEVTASAVDILGQTIIANPDTLTVAARTLTPLDKSYRFFRVRYILLGNDSVGTGIKLDEVEFKVYTD